MHYTKLNDSLTNPVFRYIFKREPLKITLYSNSFEGTKKPCVKEQTKINVKCKIYFFESVFFCESVYAVNKTEWFINESDLWLYSKSFKAIQKCCAKEKANIKVIIHKKSWPNNF